MRTRRIFDTPIPSVLALPLGIAAAWCGAYAFHCIWYDELLLSDGEELAQALQGIGLGGLMTVASYFFAFCGLFLLCSVAGAFIRRPQGLSLVRKGFVLSYLAFWFYAYVQHKITGVLLDLRADFDGAAVDGVTTFYTRWEILNGPFTLVCVMVLLHVAAWKRVTLNLYFGESRMEAARGDNVYENLRSHGDDPRHRKSWWSSTVTHITYLFLLPWLLTFLGCIENYRVPKGSGDPVVQLVKYVKPKKIKKKKYIFNPQSAISFYVPELDDSEVLREVQEQTELTYKANPNARAGKMGKGGGKEGGWPEGMEDGKVRFIRLEYSGGLRWDDGMDRASGADINFLREFHNLTGFKVGSRGESHRISLLSRYDPGYQPPFVYITGDGGIRTSRREDEILRDYLMDGGLLFADAGSPTFDRAFRSWILRVLPGQRLVDISDDDPIFQFPYSFPNGAPPLWHHGGNRALGIKVQGRWCVFYHPGDINDAWKTGASGLDPDMTERAYNMGVNIVYYSFTQYLEMTRKYRR